MEIEQDKLQLDYAKMKSYVYDRGILYIAHLSHEIYFRSLLEMTQHCWYRWMQRLFMHNHEQNQKQEKGHLDINDRKNDVLYIYS